MGARAQPRGQEGRGLGREVVLSERPQRMTIGGIGVTAEEAAREGDERTCLPAMEGVSLSVGRPCRAGGLRFPSEGLESPPQGTEEPTEESSKTPDSLH